MSKRVNILLSDATVQALERVATKGTRSRFVSDAVLYYIRERGMRRLRIQLKAGYQTNATDSLNIAMDYFPLEEQAWQKATPTGRK